MLLCPQQFSDVLIDLTLLQDYVDKITLNLKKKKLIYTHQLTNEMSVQGHGEHVDSCRGNDVLSAGGDAVSLRHHVRLPRRNDMPPVRIQSHRQHPRIVFPERCRVVHADAGAVGDVHVQRRNAVVRLHHEVLGTFNGIQRVTGLRRKAKTL